MAAKIALLLPLAIFLPHSAAQSSQPAVTTLHTFTGQNGDGGTPAGALLTGKNGVLFGTTEAGGNNSCPLGGGGCGTVFRLTPPATPSASWTETVLYTFQGGADGISPMADLVMGANGAIYGVTAEGGGTECLKGHGCGTVFELTPPAAPGDAWREAVIHRFTAGSDGAYPNGLAMDASGVLYGTTSGGGTSQFGTVFQLTRPVSAGQAWNEKVLYTFTGAKNGDGDYPNGVLIGPGGALYGSTYYGGNINSISSAGCGTIFELIPPTATSGSWQETVLYKFSDSDGLFPQSGLVFGLDGDLYGTTVYGGLRGCGTVFRVHETAPGGTWTESVLYSFQGQADGEYPSMIAVGNEGSLFGTAFNGGTASASCEGGTCGTVFKLSPSEEPGGSWTETTLHSFDGSDGSNPFSLIFGADAILYGTTLYGGTSNVGTVFELTP